MIALMLAAALAGPADGEAALAREAVSRDERALAEDWKRGRAELKTLKAREDAELDSARRAGGPRLALRARLRALRARWAETRRLARARWQLGRRALKDHLRRARRELERVAAQKR